MPNPTKRKCPLTKRWQLKEHATVYSTRTAPVEAHVYFDPDHHDFYGRVPEELTGELFIAPTVAAVVEAMKPALEAWVAQRDEVAEEDDTRVWTRVIRVQYSGARVGALGVERLHKAHYADTTLPYIRHQPWIDAVGADHARFPGTLHFARAEWARIESPRRDPHHHQAHTADWREWAEDWAVRKAAWDASGKRETTWRERPRRERWTGEVPGEERWRRKDSYHHQANKRPSSDVIVLPWDPATWDALGAFTRRFGQLDEAIRALLDRDDLADRLIAAGGNLLATPGVAQEGEEG